MEFFNPAVVENGTASVMNTFFRKKRMRIRRF